MIIDEILWYINATTFFFSNVKYGYALQRHSAYLRKFIAKFKTFDKKEAVLFLSKKIFVLVDFISILLHFPLAHKFRPSNLLQNVAEYQQCYLSAFQTFLNYTTITLG